MACIFQAEAENNQFILELPMEHVPTIKVQRELDEINEKLRKDVIRTIEPYGLKKIADLEAMSDSERTKWLFWNIHENIDDIRKCEPALIGQVIRTQLTVSDGQSLWT
jgi:hypothetical protein